MTRTLFTCCALVTLTGCYEASYKMAGDLDINPGGAQDFDQIRMMIDDGVVPLAENFAPAGLLNEHDLPLSGNADCAGALCLSAATGLGRIEARDQDVAWVQLGMDSGYTFDDVQREPQNLAVVIDISGSMTDYFEDVRFALHQLADQLNGSDEITLITYGDRTEVHMGWTSGSNKDRLHRKIDALKIDGSTNMEAGMKLGYEKLVQKHHASKQSRMLLFTDARPNVGATEATEFQDLVSTHGEQDIGFTLLGVGYSFQAGLGIAISDYRGANFYYLEDSEDIEATFDDFNLMVTPVAYDVEMTINSKRDLAGTWNIQGAGNQSRLTEAYIATLFFSRAGEEGGGGGSFVAVDPGPLTFGDSIGTLSLTYEDALLDLGVQSESFSLILDDAAGGYGTDGFSDVGVRKGSALINQVEAMITACDAYHSGGDVATVLTDVYDPALSRLASEAAAMKSDALGSEVELMEKLRQNLLATP